MEAKGNEEERGGGGGERGRGRSHLGAGAGSVTERRDRILLFLYCRGHQRPQRNCVAGPNTLVSIRALNQDPAPLYFNNILSHVRKILFSIF